MAMSAAIAHITTTVLGVIDTFGVFLETERSGVDITCAIELDVEAARVIFHLSIVHKSALLNCVATFRPKRNHRWVAVSR